MFLKKCMNFIIFTESAQWTNSVAMSVYVSVLSVCGVGNYPLTEFMEPSG